ncbi:DUF6134 family protein [Dongia deserti]|uniref:DUF6134 family protein n=1 Tax=Dongia deserti TaxID=2268030 RepID=UPI000E65634E|nr:DUF6134 family protein [Dongia deserti]
MLRLASPVNIAINSALMRRVALATGLIVSLLSTAGAATLSPESAQTGTYAYQVTRDGEVVGEQRADFERRGNELRVITDVRINITLLGMNVYDFTQRIEESWQDGVLMSLTSVAVDDGNTRNVKLARNGDRLVGTYDGKKRDLPGHLVPSTLWNSAVVEHASVLETTKGRERTFTVTQKGVEQVKLPIGTVRARHFVFTGNFKREAWYDESGVLVAAQMEAKDGSIIRQELLRMP